MTVDDGESFLKPEMRAADLARDLGRLGWGVCASSVELPPVCL